jgi:antitoxin component of MazEF toxin-antitoxin module
MTSPSEQTIFKTGNSLTVSLPARLVDQLGLAAGQKVIVKSYPESSRIIYEFPDAQQLPLLHNPPSPDKK